MALDRFVYWSPAKPRPTHEELLMLLQDFFGGAAKITWDQDRWFCVLPGTPSEPFRRLRDDAMTRGRQEGLAEERWIEICPSQHGKDHRGNVDVITRQADRFTNALAEDLAQLIAHCWEAERSQS